MLQKRAPPTKTYALPEHPSLISGLGCTIPAVLLLSKASPPIPICCFPSLPFATDSCLNYCCT
ncbi:hypothetical protein FIBSPDRAFT_875568, partial [Athelia psychrophila]